MDDQSELPAPKSPESRALAERSRADDEKERQREEREARLKPLHDEFEKQALIRGVDDEATRQIAADNMATLLAARGARPEPDGSIDWRMHPSVIGEAIKGAYETADSNRRQEEQEARLAREAELAAREQERRQQQEAEEAQKQQLIDNAKGLGAKDDVAAASWVAQAETSDRQHHQGGRYDVLKGFPPGNNPSSSRGGSPPPRDPAGPTPPSPPGPTKEPLSANEVLQRFGNPDLEARYQQQEEQRRAHQTKSASSTPATAASVAALQQYSRRKLARHRPIGFICDCGDEEEGRGGESRARERS